MPPHFESSLDLDEGGIQRQRRRKAIRVALVALILLDSGCALTGNHMNVDYATSQQYISADVGNRGYRQKEAAQFIEFCVELDNQDDRVKDRDNNVLKPHIDPALWNPLPVYDSRLAVAKDIAAYSKKAPDGGEEHWTKLYDETLAKAKRAHSGGWDEETIAGDPNLNGFDPWQNAWLLYEGIGEFAGSYAIAIRGTVFSNQPSATEDAWFHAVGAKGFLSAKVNFAESDSATLHSGFAHATFSLLLDDRYGVLRILEQNNIKPNARLYIVGHSQGAAMATLVHAFMHYAMKNDERAANPVFELKGKNFKLKSYGFAQPKPGNYAFSVDFASITQRYDSSIVINNHIDPVPQVPLTLEATGDIEGDFRGESLSLRALQFISGIGKGFRQSVAFVAEPFVKNSAKGYGYFYHYDNIKPIGKDDLAASWHFWPAGDVRYVFGVPGDPNDLFLQHHATTYRQLIGEQLKN